MDNFEAYYRSLYEVVRVVNSTLDPGLVLNKIAEQTAKAMGVKGCTLRLLDSASKRLLAGASYGLSREYMRKGPVEVEKSGVDKEALGGQTIYIADACNDPRFQYPEAAKEERIQSMLITPLMIEGKAIGVLRIYSETARRFDAAEEEFLSAIASVSAIAIENARLHHALKRDYDLMEAFEYRVFVD